ncbi:hypothetical protein AVEN_251566-1 [Araneus ventricosus]|uniref:Uncharacterized protein n=1 Tax=Araneus ventricosus TaxID=182803 RepID=A0A4Y2FH24_ARAVE|nr:hypothetical protein AVEN_251566-1 [Araneus ventricosus]
MLFFFFLNKIPVSCPSNRSVTDLVTGTGIRDGVLFCRMGGIGMSRLSSFVSVERKRLKLKFPEFDQEKDEEECAKMINVYHSNPHGHAGPAGPSYSRRPSASSSASSTPVTTPVHRLRLKPRSASSSPKRQP